MCIICVQVSQRPGERVEFLEPEFQAVVSCLMWALRTKSVLPEEQKVLLTAEPGIRGGGGGVAEDIAVLNEAANRSF